jgi:hypothetical protein
MKVIECLIDFAKFTGPTFDNFTANRLKLDAMRGSTSTRQHLHIGDETLIMKLLERGVLTLN